MLKKRKNKKNIKLINRNIKIKDKKNNKNTTKKAKAIKKPYNYLNNI